MINTDMPSKLEQHHLLYDDLTGKTVSIDQVYMLDPIPVERIPRLRMLLSHENLFVVWQAAQVLTAWADPVGLDALEGLIDRRVHTVMEFAPHRIYGYDNVYDEMADALSQFPARSQERAPQRRRMYEKLLELYGPCDFEGRLKYALLKCEFPDLAPAIDRAITRAKAYQKLYLASQLLPPLAHFAPHRALDRFSEFSTKERMSPNPEVNVAEALRYLEIGTSRPWLERLIHHADKVVAAEARRSLAAVAST